MIGRHVSGAPRMYACVKLLKICINALIHSILNYENKNKLTRNLFSVSFFESTLTRNSEILPDFELVLKAIFKPLLFK